MLKEIINYFQSLLLTSKVNTLIELADIINVTTVTFDGGCYSWEDVVAIVKDESLCKIYIYHKHIKHNHVDYEDLTTLNEEYKRMIDTFAKYNNLKLLFNIK